MVNDEKTITNPRRVFLLETLNVDRLKGLEIGALTDPLVTKEEVKDRGEIFYLDHMATDELREKYADDTSVDVEKIVSVDFVCRDGNIIEATSGNTFDYVIASHVIEHTPNLVKFLKEIIEILNPGGILFLVVPDKRFTFDVNRPETTFGQILEAYLSDCSKPSVSSVYDHLSSAVSVDAGKIWQEPVDAASAPTLAPLSLAWETACNLEKTGKYIDVHVNIFTPYSFLMILKKIILHGICSFQLRGFKDTAIGQLDFYVALVKPEFCHEKKSMSELLTEFPKIQLESILSPYMPQVKSLSNALERNIEITRNLQEELHRVTMELREKASQLEISERCLEVSQRVLDRKSVKLTLSLVHKISNLLSKVR